ncbi:protein of unknown function [Streptomyces sp. KY75]|nr:protein of unknown function [Streptomyces sp. KY75]CAD5974050.1 protein of unknown function [Streptomyces sp. KY70]
MRIEGTVFDSPPLSENPLVLPVGLTRGGPRANPDDTVEPHRRGRGRGHVEPDDRFASVDSPINREGRAVEDEAGVPDLGELEERAIAQVDVVDGHTLVVHSHEDVTPTTTTQVVGQSAHCLTDGVTALALTLGAALELKAGGFLSSQQVGQIHVFVAHILIVPCRPALRPGGRAMGSETASPRRSTRTWSETMPTWPREGRRASVRSFWNGSSSRRARVGDCRPRSRAPYVPFRAANSGQVRRRQTSSASHALSEYAGQGQCDRRSTADSQAQSASSILVTHSTIKALVDDRGLSLAPHWTAGERPPCHHPRACVRNPQGKGGLWLKPSLAYSSMMGSCPQRLASPSRSPAIRWLSSASSRTTSPATWRKP